MMTDTEILKTFSIQKTAKGYLETTFLPGAEKGEDNIRQAQLYSEAVLALYKEEKKAQDMLVDVLPVGDSFSEMSQTSKDIYQDLIDNEKTRRVAIVAKGNPFMTIASFINGIVTQNRKIKFFTNKEKAIAWLEEDY